jgi:hypothetical protein
LARLLDPLDPRTWPVRLVLPRFPTVGCCLWLSQVHGEVASEILRLQVHAALPFCYILRWPRLECPICLHRAAAGRAPP